VLDWSSSLVVLEWAVAALLAAIFLPLFLSGRRRSGGGAARLTLALAVGLALAAAGAATTEMDAPGRVLHLAAVLALICGLVGLVGLTLFDLVLPAIRVSVPSILRDVLQIAVAAVAVMVCLRLAGLDVLPLLATSAVLTAVIGLALQAPIANVFSGLALQLDRTLGEGDWIEVGSHSGRIVEIGWRSTRVVTEDGETLFLPNSQLLSGEVLNLSHPTGAHRVSVRVSVHERHPPGAVRQVLVDAIRDVPGVLDYPLPDALIADLGDAAVVYEVRYWVAEFERAPAIAGEVRARLWYAVRRAHFETPLPAVRVALGAGAGKSADELAEQQADCAALLREVEALAALDGAARERLAARTRRVDFTTGETIFHQGMVGDALYIVDRGEVGVRVQLDESTAEVARLGRGDVFGEMALMTGEPRAATCIARTEVTCYAVDRDVFRVLLEERPEVAESLSAMRAARQASLDAQRTGLSGAARGRAEAEQGSQILDRIRNLFGGTTQR
jgi:small-conductance mechanosensitive channel/CRP-like cAMP-binding protein